MSRSSAGPRARTLALLLAAASLAPVAKAASYTKADNTTAMNVATSWSPNGIPGASDTVSWAGTYATAGSLYATLGANTSWQGITVGSLSGAAAGTIYIGGFSSTATAATGAYSLTIGSSGINMSSASNDLVINATVFDVTGSQTWTVASGKFLRFTTSVKSSAAVAASAKMGAGTSSTVITIAGAGTVDLNQGGSTGFTDAAGFTSYLGKWQVNSGATLRGLRNGSTAWGANTSADAILLNGGTLADGGISGANGDWTWNTNISLAAGTSSTIDNQIPSGTDRFLKLNGAFTSLDANTTLTFKETSDFSNIAKGFVITGTNTNLKGTVNIGTGSGNGVNVRLGGIAGTNATLDAGTTGDFGTAAVVITTNSTLNLSRNNTYTLANNISGAGKLYVGSGITAGSPANQSVTLSGTNTFSGGTELLLGSLSVSNLADAGGAGSLGTGYLAVKTGAVFNYTGATGSTTRNLFLDNGAATINVTDANAVLTWTDASTKGGASGALITKGGAGTLVLDGAITSGGTTAVTVSAGTLRLNGTNTYTGATTVSSGATLDVAGSGSLASTTAIALAGSLSVSTSANQSLGGAITGAGSLSKSGTGTLTLSSTSNTYSGGTTISGGTLALGASGVLADTGAVTVSGGILDISTYSETIGSLSLSSGSVTGTTGVLTSAATVNVSNASGTTTIAAILGGTSALSKTGNGELVLSKANTFSGGTTLSAGTLTVSGSVGAVTVSAGTLSVSGSAGAVSVANGAKLRGTGTVGGVTLANGAIVDAGISGVGSLALGDVSVAASAQATLNVLNVGNYASTAAFSAGALTFGSGGSILLNVSGSAGIGSYSLLSYTGSVNSASFSLNSTGLSTRSTAELDFGTAGVVKYLVSGNQPKWRGVTTDWSGTSAWVLTPLGTNTDFLSSDAVLFDDSASSGTVSVTANVDPASLSFTASTLDYTLSSGGGVITAGSLSKTGSALLTIGGANTYSAGSTLSAGRTRVAHDSALGTGTITLGNAALSSDGATARTLANNLLLAGNPTLGNATDNGTLTLNGAVDLGGTGRSLTIASATTLGGVISNGSLTKLGSATLTLSGANTYTGGTTVSAGTLALGANDVLADTGAVTLASGTTLDATGRTDTLGVLSIDNATVTGGTLSASSVSITTGTISSVLAGSGGLTKTGNGTLTLSGTHTFTGTVNVSAGTLRLGSGQALGTVDKTAGKVVVASGATLDLNGVAATYGYTLSGTGVGGAGAMVNNGAAIGTGLAQTSNLKLAANATIGGTADWALLTNGYAATSLDLAGYTLTKSGTNTFSLANTAVTAGRILVSGGQVALFNTTSTAASTALEFSASGTVGLTMNGLSASFGSIEGGSGSATIALGAGTLTVGNLNSSTSYAGLITGTGGLTKVGTGTLTLTNASGTAYTGVTTVNAGVLQLGTSATLNGGLTSAATTGDVNFGANTLVISGTGGTFYTGKLTGTGAIQLRGGSASIVNSDGTAGTSGNYQIWTAVTAVIQATSSQFFALDTGASATDRKDFGFINDTNNALNLSSLSGFGAIRNDAGNSAVRQIVVDQSGGDTVFSGALLSHKTATATRQMTLTKRGTSSLTLAGFIGKQTGSQAGTSFVNLTVEAGTLNVTNAANTTTTNTDALSLGTINITGGTLSFSSQALRNTAGTVGALAINLNGGTLAWNTGNTQDISAGGKLTLVAGKEGRLDVGSNNVTLGTAFAGGAIAASVTKLGNGALAITAANSYTGATTLSAGTLQAGNDSAFGTGTLALNGGTLSSDGATARTLANAVTVGGAVTLGSATNNGALTLSGGVDLGGATRTLTVASASTLSGIVANGGLTKAGNGTLTLSGANSYAGGTTVNAGTLSLGAAERLLDTGAVTVNTNGTLDLGGFAETVGTLTLAGGSVANGTLTASTLDIRSGTLGAVLSGSATLTKTTSGVATLSGTQASFTGTTSVDAGTLVVSGSLSGSTVNVAGGATLSVTGSLSGSTSNVASGGVLRGTGSAGAVNLATGGQVQAGVGGVGSLSIGSLTVADANVGGLYITDVVNYTSGNAFDIASLSLGTGSSLAINLSGSYAAGTYKLLGYSGAALSDSNLAVIASGLSTRFNGSLDFSTAGQVLYTLQGSKVYWVGDASQWSAADNWKVLVDGNWTPTTYANLDESVFDDQGGSATIDVDVDVTLTSVAFTGNTAAYTLQGAKGIQGGAFLKSGTGSVTINNANAFTSGTISGGTVTLGAAAALGTTASVALNGGTLDINGQSIANSLVLGGGSLVGNGAISGVISGSGALSKSAAGTLTLSGQNTYTGGTTVSNGVLVLGHATDTLADTGAVTVSGGELSLGSNSDTVGALTLSSGSITGTGTLTAASLTTDVAGTASVSANLAGSFALTKSGAGTLTLSGQNTYSGGTTVSNGVLALGHATNTLANAGAVTVSGGELSLGSNSDTVGAVTLSSGSITGSGTLTAASLTTSVAGSASVSANLAGTFAVTKTGAGTLTLSGTNTYSGGTTVSNGVLSFANGSLGTTGNIAVNGGTLRWASGNTQDISSRLTYAASGSVNLDTNGNTVTLASVVGGATTSSLTKSGNGTLVLTATANYTGATNVTAGTLQIGNGGATGDIGSVSTTNLVTVSTGATLRFFRTGTIDYKASNRMRAVAGAGDIVIDGGAKFFNYAGTTGTTTTGFAEANSWANFSGRLVVVGGSEFQTIRNGRTAMGSAQVVLGDATTSGILSQIEGSWTWTNNIQLVGSANIIRNNATNSANGADRYLKLQGVLSGSGNVTLADATGAFGLIDRGFILTGANTLTGQITVDTFVRVGGAGGDSTDLGAGATGDLGSASVVVNSGAGKALVFSRTNALTAANVISGAGQVRIGSTTLAATSTQAITLSGANTYTGGTEVLNGSLTVNALSGIGSYTTGNEGYLAVKNGSTFTYAGASDTTARNLYLDVGAATLNVTDANATLRWTDTVSAKGGASGGLITKGGAGTLVLDGAITAGGSTAVKVSGGTLRLNGANDYAGATTIDAGATLDIAGTGSLLSTTALTVNGTLRVSTASNQTFSTAIGGASTGSLLKTGNGILSLSGDNSSYAGSVTVSGGTLALGHLSGLGTGVISVLTGGTLDFANLAANNSIALGGGTLLNYGSWTGGLVVNYAGATGADIEAILTTYGRSTVSVQAGGTLSLAGMTKNVVFQGGTLSDLGAYTGTVTVRGALDLSAGLPASSGTVRIESGSVNFGGNTFGGTVQYVGGAITNYAGLVNVVGTNPLLTAANLNGANLVLGTGTTASIGTGLTADIRLEGGSILGNELNNLTGKVTVTNGITLDLGGAAGSYAINNLNAAIVLESGATLKGTASVGSITAKAGSILAPGNSPGDFKTGSMVLEGGSGYDFDIQTLFDPNTGQPGAAGFDYDTITVDGQLDLSALTYSSQFLVNLLSLDMFGASGAPVGWDPATEFELKMFTYGSLKLGDGATLSSLFLINSDGFFDANYIAVAKGHFSIIDDRANHEIRLAYSVIPEPSTYGLMLGGLALAAAAIRRRRMKEAKQD